jgi:hypothetical protein
MELPALVIMRAASDSLPGGDGDGNVVTMTVILETMMVVAMVTVTMTVILERVMVVKDTESTHVEGPVLTVSDPAASPPAGARKTTGPTLARRLLCRYGLVCAYKRQAAFDLETCHTEAGRGSSE